MNRSRRDKNSSTLSIRLMCAIVFVVFSFYWLYFFQADMMMMTQHVLSHGMTRYHPLLGTVLITLVLWAIQFIVYALVI